MSINPNFYAARILSWKTELWPFYYDIIRCLIKILVEIGKLGNGGHSYTIFIGDKSFGFDGDGADQISSINDFSLNKDLFSNTYKLIDIYNKGIDKKEEDTLNENKSIKINLTENELRKLIKESVKKILVKNI
jgi:hypothetical protein